MTSQLQRASASVHQPSSTVYWMLMGRKVVPFVDLENVFAHLRRGYRVVETEPVGYLSHEFLIGAIQEKLTELKNEAINRSREDVQSIVYESSKLASSTVEEKETKVESIAAAERSTIIAQFERSINCGINKVFLSPSKDSTGWNISVFTDYDSFNLTFPLSQFEEHIHTSLPGRIHPLCEDQYYSLTMQRSRTVM